MAAAFAKVVIENMAHTQTSDDFPTDKSIKHHVLHTTRRHVDTLRFIAQDLQHFRIGHALFPGKAVPVRALPTHSFMPALASSLSVSSRIIRSISASFPPWIGSAAGHPISAPGVALTTDNPGRISSNPGMGISAKNYAKILLAHDQGKKR